MIELRDYQKEISAEAGEVLRKYGFVYLAMQVRTGKTLTSMATAELVGANNVLFLTKKKAISSIMSDYKLLSPDFNIEVTNYESMHKAEMHPIDLIVLDEAHGFGAFPKPSKRTKELHDIIARNNPYVIYLSGTPTPESYSQIYHQFWVLGNRSPFARYKNFYKWAHEFVSIKQRRIGGLVVNDYSMAKDPMIDQVISKYKISFTQEEAGFESSIEEEILWVDMPNTIRTMSERLKRDLVIEGKEEVVLADTGAKLMQKIHQIHSGTVKFESGNSMVISTYKAEAIRDKFRGKKIGVFYKFVEELNALKSVFEDTLTTDIDTFNNTDCKVIALQIVSGREGISLRNAEYLVFYNIDFSATSYWQARDRMTTKDRLYNKVYWVFSRGGIEEKIYKVVNKKKAYTVSHFKKDLLSL